MQDLILKNIKKGDIKAFETLILQYEKLYFNIAFRMLNDREDARDVTQDSLIKIYKNIDKCDSVELFKSWSCKIVTNTTIDYIRSKKRKYTSSLDAGLEGEEGDYYKQIESKEPTPEETLIKKELKEEILDAIKELPENYKTVLILRDLNGLSYDEISKITENSLGTVKSRISRARNMLKEKLSHLAEQKHKKNV